MWLSERGKMPVQDGGAEWGTVTLEGNPAGVYLNGERRDLPILGPGGFAWVPQTGDQVMVIKAGADGETPCVAGVRPAVFVRPGVVKIYSGNRRASITLDLEGNIDLQGHVTANGKEL